MANQVTHTTAKTQFISAKTATYAYRTLGPKSGTPILLLHHFRATMDFWDPALVDRLAASRPVILVDNAGIGKSTGEVATTVKAMAANIVEFLSALKPAPKVDVLGFSMGGFATQMLYLIAPKGSIGKLIIAGSSPSFGEGVLAHSEERQAEIAKAAAGPEPGVEEMGTLFFSKTEVGKAAARDYWERVHERSKGTSGEERSGMVSEGYADGGEGMKRMVEASTAWGSSDERADGSFDRLGEIDCPVFIGQGSDDFMIPTVNSFVLQQRLPNAWLKIFPDSGHGFLYQYAEEFSKDIDSFLSR